MKKLALLVIFNFTLTFLFTIARASSVITPVQVPPKFDAKELKDFQDNSPAVKKLIYSALTLANQHLTYRYGSANPKNGGMDCSGTIQYLLKNQQIKNVPRQADGLYRWVWQKGHFYAVNSLYFSSFEFNYLKPGDLLFWSGTYTIKRDPPITHVMLYLGENSHGQPLMFGSSEHRSFHGEIINGVSLFDFRMPSTKSQARFLGYSCIPTINCPP